MLPGVWSSGDGVSWREVTNSPPWAPLGADAAINLEDEIWILSDYYFWSSSDGASWSARTRTLNRENSPGSVVVFDDRIWALGEDGVQYYSPDMALFDVVGDHTLPRNMPVVHGHTLGA
jgi:hypothetical protein